MGKAPQIIKAHNVIGMRVGENNGIDIANIFAERLCPKIGPRVHHPRAVRGFDIDGRAQSLIARIGRSTHRAVTPDHRDALGSAGAEERNGELRVLLAKAFGVER